MKTKSKTTILIAAITMTLCSCKSSTQLIEVPVYIHDTTRTVQLQHDSVYIDNWHTQWQRGDTIFIHDSIDRWRSMVKVDTAYQYVELPIEITKMVEKEKELTTIQCFQIFSGVIFHILIIITTLVLAVYFFVKRKKL